MVSLSIHYYEGADCNIFECFAGQRLRWNSEALTVLEDSLGPLFALDGPLPGSDRLEHIRNSTQVLQKYSVQQIYQKLFKMINKKKKQEASKTFGQN